MLWFESESDTTRNYIIQLWSKPIGVGFILQWLLLKLLREIVDQTNQLQLSDAFEDEEKTYKIDDLMDNFRNNNPIFQTKKQTIIYMSTETVWGESEWVQHIYQ